jgi:hypothetical protein
MESSAVPQPMFIQETEFRRFGQLHIQEKDKDARKVTIFLGQDRPYILMFCAGIERANIQQLLNTTIKDVVDMLRQKGAQDAFTHLHVFTGTPAEPRVLAEYIDIKKVHETLMAATAAAEKKKKHEGRSYLPTGQSSSDPDSSSDSD